jgi:hypothetical protein
MGIESTFACNTLNALDLAARAKVDSGRRRSP